MGVWVQGCDRGSRQGDGGWGYGFRAVIGVAGKVMGGGGMGSGL